MKLELLTLLKHKSKINIFIKIKKYLCKNVTWTNCCVCQRNLSYVFKLISISVSEQQISDQSRSRPIREPLTLWNSWNPRIRGLILPLQSSVFHKTERSWRFHTWWAGLSGMWAVASWATSSATDARIHTQRHCSSSAGCQSNHTRRHTHTHAHTDAHRHTQTHTDTHRHTQTHARAHTHTHTHTHTHRHAHTHTHTRLFL